MNVQMYEEGASLLKAMFFEKLGSNPKIDEEGRHALFEKCVALGEDLRAVWNRAAICSRMIRAYPEGHPAAAGWLNEFVALLHYEEYLVELENYRREFGVSKDPSWL